MRYERWLEDDGGFMGTPELSTVYWWMAQGVSSGMLRVSRWREVMCSAHVLCSSEAVNDVGLCGVRGSANRRGTRTW